MITNELEGLVTRDGSELHVPVGKRCCQSTSAARSAQARRHHLSGWSESTAPEAEVALRPREPLWPHSSMAKHLEFGNNRDYVSVMLRKATHEFLHSP